MNIRDSIQLNSERPIKGGQTWVLAPNVQATMALGALENLIPLCF